MPNNKSQHYVPQFFLKNFSVDRKCISLYLKYNDRIIDTVSIKTQCCKDYFYPDLQYEKALSKFEDFSKKVISRAITENKTLTTTELNCLSAFVVLQRSRTLHQAQMMKEGFDQLLEYFHSENMTDELKATVSSYENSQKNMVSIIADSFSRSYEMTRDMTCKVLEYNGEGSFITSDDPVIMYNPFLEQRGKMSYGLAAMGLLLILPISSKRAIILYDSGVNKIGNRKDTVVRFSNPKDLHYINILTVLHADKAIYFLPGTHSIQELRELNTRAAEINQSERMKYDVYEAEDGSSEMIRSFGGNFYIGATFSFLKTLDKARGIRIPDTYSVIDYSRPYCNRHLIDESKGVELPTVSFRKRR